MVTVVIQSICGLFVHSDTTILPIREDNEHNSRILKLDSFAIFPYVILKTNFRLTNFIVSNRFLHVIALRKALRKGQNLY